MNKLLWLLALLWICPVRAQHADSTLERLSKLPRGYVSTVESSIAHIESRVVRESSKYLKKLSGEEKRLQKKLSRIDTSMAKSIFYQAQSEYLALQENMKGRGKWDDRVRGIYIPFLDSLQTSLKFLEAGDLEEFATIKGVEEINTALEQIASLKEKLNQMESIQSFIVKRREILAQQFLELGFLRDLKRFNQQIHDYSLQIEEIRQSVKDPEKLISKSLDIMQKIPAFQKFFAQNSELNKLFPTVINAPSDLDNIQTISGLQTRFQLNQLIQGRIGSAGTNGLQQMQSNVQQAQSQFQQFRDRLAQLGQGNLQGMPELHRNSEKVKSFWKRIELGLNLQTVRSKGLLPVYSDFGLTAGYKFSDRWVAGMGVGWKMGWGNSIRKIDISAQGASVRAYMDARVKNYIWFSAGYEMNYFSEFNSIDQLKAYSEWKKSGLAGVTMKLPTGSKFIKKSKVSFLWDFLSYTQVPRTQPFVARFGYDIK